MGLNSSTRNAAGKALFLSVAEEIMDKTVGDLIGSYRTVPNSDQLQP